MRRLERLVRLAGVLAVLLVGACASALYRQPVVTLETVRVGSIGLRGGTLLVTLRVENPNRFELSADELEYRLAIADTSAPGDTAWTDFAVGTYEQAFTVAPGGTSSVEIPVDFSYGGLGNVAAAVLDRGSFTYRAEGTVDVRTPIGRREVPFRRHGTVSLLNDR